MKRFIFKLLLSGITLLVLGGIAEVVLRAQERAQIQAMEDADKPGGVTKSDIPGLNYVLTPGYRSGEIVFNSLGFNMPEREVTKNPAVTRVAFVGDSVTQGVGITNTAEAYPNRIDAILPDAFEVWNCGVGGYNTEQIYLQMKHILPAFSPDAIVYGFNFNDYWDANRYFFGNAALLPEQAESGKRAGLLDQLKKLRIVLRMRDAYAELAYRVRGYWPVYVDRKTGYPSWKRMKDIILMMRDDCAQAGRPFAVVILPNKQFLHVDPAKNKAHADIASFLAREGIPFLDLLPALKEHRDEPLYLKDGNHMTPAGYERVAQQVAAWMEERKDLFAAP